MRSDAVKRGVERAPHRSLLRALGCTDREMDQPFIGVINSYNEAIPGHAGSAPDCRCGQGRHPHGRRHAL